LLLAGCGAPAAPAGLADAGPAFDPLAFFAGHETSWGVEENRGGTPIAIVTTDCQGRRTADGGIDMVQILHIGQAPAQRRIWHLRRTGPAQYEATANDMDGTAEGTVSGRRLHWRWVLETRPGNGLANVTMEQNMYRMDDGAVMVRSVVSKLGIRILQVSEQFEPAPGAAAGG
jgi:hypothetical protein